MMDTTNRTEKSPISLGPWNALKDHVLWSAHKTMTRSAIAPSATACMVKNFASPLFARYFHQARQCCLWAKSTANNIPFSFLPTIPIPRSQKQRVMVGAKSSKPSEHLQALRYLTRKTNLRFLTPNSTRLQVTLEHAST